MLESSWKLPKIESSWLRSRGHMGAGPPAAAAAVTSAMRAASSSSSCSASAAACASSSASPGSPSRRFLSARVPHACAQPGSLTLGTSFTEFRVKVRAVLTRPKTYCLTPYSAAPTNVRGRGNQKKPLVRVYGIGSGRHLRPMSATLVRDGASSCPACPATLLTRSSAAYLHSPDISHVNTMSCGHEQVVGWSPRALPGTGLPESRKTGLCARDFPGRGAPH